MSDQYRNRCIRIRKAELEWGKLHRILRRKLNRRGLRMFEEMTATLWLETYKRIGSGS